MMAPGAVRLLKEEIELASQAKASLLTAFARWGSKLCAAVDVETAAHARAHSTPWAEYAEEASVKSAFQGIESESVLAGDMARLGGITGSLLLPLLTRARAGTSGAACPDDLIFTERAFFFRLRKMKSWSEKGRVCANYPGGVRLNLRGDAALQTVGPSTKLPPPPPDPRRGPSVLAAPKCLHAAPAPLFR